MLVKTRYIVTVLAVVAALACNKSKPERTPQERAERQAALAKGIEEAMSKSQQAAAANPVGPLDASSEQRARQIVEQLYGPVLGGVDIVAVTAEAGLLHATFRQHGHIDGKPLSAWLSVDGKLAFPLAWDVGERTKQIQADQRLASCARSKGVRVYGDPRQPETAKQLDEFGAFGREVLVDCSAAPDQCKDLGQTTLPLTAIAGQRVPAFVPRAQIEKLSGCQ